MNTTTLLLIAAAGEPSLEGSLASATQREGRIGTITWSAPAECDDLADAAGDTRSTLTECEHEYHVWVTQGDMGWIGHRRWQGTHGLRTDEDAPQASCGDSMVLLAAHAASHCAAAEPPDEPTLANAEPDEEPPSASEDTPVAPPLAGPRSGSPLLVLADVSLLAGFGQDDQAFGRGGTLGVGFDAGRWRVVGLVAYEQMFHMGEEESEMSELLQPNTHLLRGGLRVCHELLHGANPPGGWDIALPLCAGIGIGQIRDPRASPAPGHETLWSGIEGSMSFEMRRRGPVAFRVGFDLVSSLPGGSSVGPDERFYEPEDFGARVYTGIVLRPEWLSHEHRQERQQERRERRERRRGRRSGNE